MIFQTASFQKAAPIWADGKQEEKNCSLWFETEIGRHDNVLLRMAGANDYQVFINDTFVFYGPARAGRGYYRVDELPIAEYLTKKTNQVQILVNAYRVDNFCFFNDEGFLCAEFVTGDQVFGATGSNVWDVFEYAEKIRKIQRYSFQRPFAEGYDYRIADRRKELTVCLCGDKNFIAREVPYPAFERDSMTEVMEMGGVERIEPKEYFRDRAICAVGKGVVDGFAIDDLEICSVWEAQKFSPIAEEQNACRLPIHLNSNTYARLSTVGERTGFLCFDVICTKDADVYLTFDEILEADKTLNFTRLGCSNVIVYKLRGGRTYHFTSAQPYSLQYLNMICIGGEVRLEQMQIIRLDFDNRLIHRTLDPKADQEIAKIYDAAVETFRQNTVDIYMDCPSRERAGWLCDSFFTSRVEHLLTGKSVVEHAFLANFAMEDEYYKNIPSGMLPMCYPSEHTEEVFIPNWSMWYVLELKEYLGRTGDREFVDELKPKLYRLLDYFKKFENTDGLLEKLESWVFLEWSRSNDLTQDINYPSNMLYYAFLNTLGELYDDAFLIERANRLKDVIREKSRCGLFFSDNSVYRNGVAELSGECTESCQYYAFFTGVADFETDKDLWNILVQEFGSIRKETKKYPEIAYSNAFIGNYLRCNLLMMQGQKVQLEKDIRGYFYGMAERTGTLWEHDSVRASCNHGFASHVLIWLNDLGYLC